MTSLVVPMPTAVRVDIGPAPWRTVRSAMTVHVGQSITLLADPRTADFLPVTDAVHGLVPGGVCLPTPGDFDAFVAVARRTGEVDLAAWRRLRVGAVEYRRLEVEPGPVSHDAALALARACAADAVDRDPPMASAGQRRGACALGEATLRNDVAAVRQALNALVGSGPGSTPAGDDVVVGLLAGLDRVGVPARCAAMTVRTVLPELLHRTTDVSRHDLQAAVDGRFAERVHTLLTALADPASVSGAVHAARTWGASSGLDIASGVAAAAITCGERERRTETVRPSLTDRRSA